MTARGGTAQHNKEQMTMQNPTAEVEALIGADGKIEVQLVRAGWLTRWPCTVCGGWTEKVGMLAEGPGGLRVCEFCLQSGDIDGRLARNAAALERYAARVRSLIGRLKVPTYEEWLHEVDRDNANDLGCTVEEYRAKRAEERKREEAESAAAGSSLGELPF